MGHIQIRNVPEDIHRTLKSRAAKEGLSLSEYLLASGALVEYVVAKVEPDEFFARTRTRIACATSAEASVNVWFVPPAMFAQLPPNWSQRSHWKVNVIGCGPVQLPGLAVSVCPSCGTPEMVGGAVFDELPEVHDADVVGDVADDGEVVSDEHVGEAVRALELVGGG